jgi:hypothetical protein
MYLEFSKGQAMPKVSILEQTNIKLEMASTFNRICQLNSTTDDHLGAFSSWLKLYLEKKDLHLINLESLKKSFKEQATILELNNLLSGRNLVLSVLTWLLLLTTLLSLNINELYLLLFTFATLILLLVWAIKSRKAHYWLGFNLIASLLLERQIEIVNSSLRQND